MPLRVVVDTCVLLAAMGTNKENNAPQFSAARAAINHITKNGLLLLSHPCMREWFWLSTRREIVQRMASPQEGWNYFLGVMRQASRIQPAVRVQATRNPKDDKWLELSKAGDAHVLLTYDRNLLRRKSFGNTAIMPVTQFMTQHVGCATRTFKGIAIRGQDVPHDHAFARRMAQLHGVQQKSRHAATAGTVLRA